MVARAAVLTALLTLVLAATAPAAVRYGSGGPDRVRGTGTADALFGLGGNDRLLARAGPLAAGPGPPVDALIFRSAVGQRSGSWLPASPS